MTKESSALWYKDAVVYQVHVRSYCDSTGTGVGDFRGLMSKLDHIQDLGATAIWIQPFFPSPLRDDGYDIADYMGVNPMYGTLPDFKAFLKAAHERGLKVIIELVLNHTSDQHPWFQRARKAKPGSRHRDFYVWSDSPKKYADARIIFKDFERSNWTWDHEAGQYFWHRFYSHQPDLNFENPDVLKGRSIRYWITGWAWALTVSGWMPFPTWRSAREAIARTCLRPIRFCVTCELMSTRSIRIACCSRKPINGQRMRWPTSVRGTNATRPFTFQ